MMVVVWRCLVPLQMSSITTESLEQVTTESLEQVTTESLEQVTTESLEQVTTESLEQVTTESSEQVTTESLEQVTTESSEQVTTESLKPANTESLDPANFESLESVKTESLEPAMTKSLESFNTAADTESLESTDTESLVSASFESLEAINIGPLHSANTESLKSANTESSEMAKTESLEPATTESLKPANTESLDSASIASLDSIKTKSLEPAMTESLESFNTAAVTESLESANTAAETESLESASTESLVSASTESLEPTSLGPLQSSNTESLTSADREFLASAGTETLELAVSDRDFENVNPAVIQERIQLVQETLIPVKPGSNFSLSTGSLPHVPTAGEDLLQDNPVRDVTQSEQHNKDLSKDNSSSTASNNDAHTKDVSVKTVQNKGTSSDTSIQNLPSEKMEARKAFSWLPKASSSSVDSFGPEEIEALWGIESSMMNLDAELTFLDTEPVAAHVDEKGVAKGDLGAQLEVPARVSLGGKDNVAEAASSGSVSDTSCDVSDPNVKDGALGKSISPVCDNNSEGSNDSGRGGSEHDMVCQGGDVPVHFNFCMPSDLCGQFIGKHGKNINYLKSRSGAHVTLTSNAFTPEYQICQIVGTQAEVDDALSMIRRKFPLQDYPHLTMDPVDMSMPLPLVPDGQVVYPEAMQLSLPEGVSVDVFVSAVVDAGQVFVQQPTHRSYMSLEKMNYFLNLVYSQDPNVPSVPLPIESGVICVCESEGYWYRAMIMSPVDENGEVQLKFVDYGGYITLPVASLKQIRVDFMNLPFQAVECFMANITPNQGEKLFSDEATQALCDLTQGKLLQCQVVARTEYGIPYIHLYQVNTERNSAVLINRALVNRRLVRWIEIL
ncbi:unnamed protein product [Candidula unifasciata]|uniref:Tudor domain-containing protein n=1 Tax=Candidula unifasciata TaxID=100452 RepID=A0A8S3ZHA8_9EUPU|nr:unnamed protein product [Candidula unifasciata]